MPLVGRRDGRNFGYGRQLSYAGPQALRDQLTDFHLVEERIPQITLQHSHQGRQGNREVPG